MATLGEKLKAIRLNRDMSQDDIAQIFGTTKQSISRYETGVNSPRLDTVADIAEKLEIELSLLINDEYSIQDVLNYKKISIKNNRIFVDSFIEKTLNNMNRLNEPAKKQVADYSDFIYSDEDNRLEELESYTELYTIGTAAVGEGVECGDYLTKYKMFMTTDIPDHDFSINVKGDSMFPTIIDGETIFVIKDYDEIDNDIYVLYIDGETSVKRVQFRDNEITLISDNEEYDNRIVTEHELSKAKILGRVVGWEMPT